MNTFQNGVHPAGSKYLTRGAAIEQGPIPEKVYIPLSQHIGAPARSRRGGGAKGEKGHAHRKGGARIVRARLFVRRGHGQGRRFPYHARGQETRSYPYRERFFRGGRAFARPFLPLTGKACSAALRKRASSAWAARRSPPLPNSISGRETPDYLIVNGAECEPYITCDFRIMTEMTDKFLKGVRCAMLACGAKKAIVGVEDNKPEAIDILSTHPLCLPGGAEGLDGEPSRSL